MQTQQIPPYSLRPGKRHNLFILAIRHFPSGLVATAIGIAFLSAPLLFRLLRENGINTITINILLTGAIIGIVPLSLIYLVTLVRSPKIRNRIENEAKQQLAILSQDLEALRLKEKEEEKEVLRLELEVEGNITANKMKDDKENERWNLLNERLRLQEETGQQNIDDASEERILAAQQVKEVKDEHEVARKELASDKSKAQKAKDRKEDERWDLLEERLLHQDETAELASQERLIVARQVKETKEEGEIVLQEYASDDLKARQMKERNDEMRWKQLHELLRTQEASNNEREKRQILRDEEYIRMRYEDGLRDQYHILFARYVRNGTDTNSYGEVLNGFAPIPQDWLLAQPEIIKNPDLASLLGSYNNN